MHLFIRFEMEVFNRDLLVDCGSRKKIQPLWVRDHLRYFVQVREWPRITIEAVAD